MTQENASTGTAYFELAVSLHLWRWPALTLAVENEWGGHDSAEKRDWLAGVLADMCTQSTGGTIPDTEDIEDVAAQVLEDEFHTVLEDNDNSTRELAVRIVKAWKDCQEGKFDEIEALRQQFVKSKRGQRQLQQQNTPRARRTEDDSDSSGTDAEVDPDIDQNGGDAMDVDGQFKAEPVIDEDGFELVQSSKGRKGRR